MIDSRQLLTGAVVDGEERVATVVSSRVDNVLQIVVLVLIAGQHRNNLVSDFDILIDCDFVHGFAERRLMLVDV